MPADSAEPSQDVSKMAAEDAAIRMQFVDDDVPEVLEQLRPPGMMRKYPRVEHVRIGQDDVRARSNGAPGILRRIAVVGEDADSAVWFTLCERIAHGLQLDELILRERFGRE